LLTLTFLGVGSAFAKRNHHANALFEAWHAGPAPDMPPDDLLLVDFGANAPLALHQLMRESGFAYLEHAGTINYPALKRIFITHLHGDHIGGLEELAASNTHGFGLRRGGEQGLPQIISSDLVLRDLWDKSLRGGLEVSSGGISTLADYFRPMVVEPSLDGRSPQFSLADRYDFGVLPMDHLRIRHRYDWPSYGLRVTDRGSGESVFYSGDARFEPDRTSDLLATPKLAFHDVQLVDEPDPVHALLSELRTLPDDMKRKVVLYHYGDTWDEPAFAFVRDEFAGFARPRHRYVLFE